MQKSITLLLVLLTVSGLALANQQEQTAEVETLEEPEAQGIEQTDAHENDSLENMDREELVAEVTELRERVNQLESELEAHNDTVPEQSAEDSIEEAQPEGPNETEFDEQPGEDTPRPGFVDRMMSGIFG